MINSYFDITTIAEWVAFIASVIFLDKKTTVWRLFIALLFLIVCTESAGWYMYTILKINNNTLPFNILMILRLSFLICFFSTALPLKKVKRLSYWILIVFSLFGLINLFFFQGFWKYNAYTEALGDLILAIASCYLLFIVLIEDEHRELFQYEYFWLANGLLFSSLGSMLLYFFLDDLFAYQKQTGVTIYDYINYVINVILYSSLIIAFICRRKTTRSLQAL